MAHAPAEHRDALHTAPPGGAPATPSSPYEERRRWWTWSRQTVVFALAVSLCVHAALLLWAGLTIWSQAPAAASQGDGETPLAVVAEGELSDIIEVGLASDIPLDTLEEPTIEIDGMDVPVPETDLSALDVDDLGDIGGAGDIDTEGGGGVFGGGSGAKFFGVEARGNRFAYVLDISGSMKDERMRLLRGALEASVGGLLDHTQFLIVMYNHEAIPLGEVSWTKSTSAAKRRQLQAFGLVEPSGSTNPVPAFNEVYAVQPPPDAIYFMTDGAFADAVSEELVRTVSAATGVGGDRVPVHCITLVERDSALIMDRLARMTGGTYTHIEGASQ